MANLLGLGEFRKDVLYQNNLPVRPRSLFTTPHTCISSNEEATYPRYGDFPKFFDNTTADQWTSGINLNNVGQNSSNFTNNNCVSNWRQNVRTNAKGILTPIYPQEDYLYSDCGVELWPFQDTWREAELESGGLGTPFTTQHGTISLRLLDRVRIDMTVDRAIRILNFKSNIVIALSSNGSSTALLHPNGRIFQYGSRVEILANDNHGNNKYAKMWYKGVSFTSEQCALVYLVDAAGTRTTTDTFWDMSQDLSLTVFYNDSRHGAGSIQEAGAILQSIQYWLSDEGIHNWIINNVRISQTPDGLVRIARNSNKYLLRTSPSNGTASLTTPFLHCTASLGQTSHLFVRRGERRMHYDGTSFIVRNAGHSAGFDEKNQLKVY